MKRWIGYAALLLATTAVGAPTGLPPGDAAAVRKVLEQYRTAWLSNDADGVRRTFTKDAVLMPHHGLDPIVGMKAITDFWFPRTTAKITILKFVRTIDEVGGDEFFVYARGHSEVAWRVEDKGATEEWRTKGTYLAILKKQADGGWLISHLMWDDIPNQRGR